MSSIPETTRRRVLAALGLGAVASIAGCAAPTKAADSSTPANTTPTPPSMNSAHSVDVPRIAADPTAIPPPISRTTPATVKADLTTKELVAEIEPGVTYTYIRYFPNELSRGKRWAD